MSADIVARLREAIDERPDMVRAALTLRPCHITGMHTPEHHLIGTCTEQRNDMLLRLLAAMQTEEGELPHGLHGQGCHWCHEVPSQERYRDRLRKTWEWAGVPVSEALAATARDGWHPGDDEAVAGAYRALAGIHGREHWVHTTDIHEYLTEQETPLPYERINIVERKMREHGLIEEATLRNRVASRLTEAGLVEVTS
jgi:hypothetical protein